MPDLTLLSFAVGTIVFAKYNRHFASTLSLSLGIAYLKYGGMIVDVGMLAGSIR